MNRSVSVWILSCGLVLCNLVPQSLAEDPFRDVVVQSARKVKAVMDSVNAESATIQNFEDKTVFKSPVLSGIKQMLEAELKQVGVNIRPEGGAVGVSATLSIAKNLDASSADARQLRIEFTISDRFGTALDSADGVFNFAPDAAAIEEAQFRLDRGKFNDNFASPSALLVGFGANADLDLYGDPNTRASFKPFLDAMDAPTGVVVANTTAKASRSSPFGLQVFSNRQAKALRIVDGKPFVDLVVGEEFSVVITNGSGKPVMTTLSLDGLNSFFKSEEKYLHGDSWVVRPKQAAEIPGFYINSTKARRFTAVPYEQSSRAEAGLGQTPIGAITVAIYDAIESTPQADFQVETRTRADGTTYTVQVPVTRTVEKTYTVMVPYNETTQGSTDIYIKDGRETQTALEAPVSATQGNLRAIISIRYRHPESRNR